MIRRCTERANTGAGLRRFAWAGIAAACCLAALLATARGEALPPRSLFVMNRDGSHARYVARVQGYPAIESPRWSHDGRQLAFGAKPAGDGPARQFVVQVDGNKLRDLGLGTLPCWSPDDKQIAFFDDDGRKPGTWVQNVDGRGRQWLSAGRAARWSPDGGRMALESKGALVVFDLVESLESPAFSSPTGQVVAGFDWSPDGQRLAVVVRGKQHDELRIVGATVATDDRQIRFSGSLDGHVSWSPDAEHLAISSDRQVKLLRVSGESPPEAVAGQHGNNWMPAWSPDGSQLAFISDRPAPHSAELASPARQWRLEEAARHLKGSIVYSLAFTPDGRRVVMGGDPVNQGVHLLDLASGQVTSLGGRGIRVAMFPDGQRFATSWHSPLVQIIDIDSHEVLREVSHGSANVRTFAVSPDGQRLVTGGLDKLLHVWDTASGELLLSFEEHRDWLTQVVFTPDGEEVVSADHAKTVRVWNVQGGKQRLELEHPAVVWGLAVSPDGRHILSGTGGSVATTPEALKIVPGDDNSVRLWDASQGTLVHEMKGHTDAAYSLDISPDGKLAASAGWDGRICLWDLQTGERLSHVHDRKGRAAEVAFSPDGRHLMVGGGGRRIERQIVEFPDEQIRLYRLVEQAPNSPAPDHEPEIEK